eukprot:6656364-Alexandrium_andersonii.AAC.1
MSGLARGSAFGSGGARLSATRKGSVCVERASWGGRPVAGAAPLVSASPPGLSRQTFASQGCRAINPKTRPR